jgi:multimeric flavodoxin WrbA
MTIVLNTIEEGAASEQISILIKGDVEVVNTSGMKIAHCMGCNQCWLKTPGVCAIKDDYECIIK